MKDRDPALLDAMHRYAAHNRRSGPAPGPPGPARVVATIVLLLVQAGLVYVAMMFALVFGMSTDPCAYQRCGDERWSDFAIVVAFRGGVAVFLVATVFAVYRLARRKHALWVPLVGIIVQMLLIAAGWFLAKQAGPIR